MERKAGLCRIERVGQITDAALAKTQTLKNGETGSIRERMEQARCAIGIGLELGELGELGGVAR